MKEKNIETERLILRNFKLEDVNDVYEYAKNPNVGPHAGWKPHESSEESKEIISQLFIKNPYCFAVVDKKSNTVIGSISFIIDRKRPNINSMELGYIIAEDFWRQGLATEAALKVIEYGFKKIKLDMIAIYRSPENIRSGNVIKKCGFIFEGTLRQSFKIFDGTIRDTLCYSMTKGEYKKIANNKKESYAYLLRCKDGSLYGGFTTDLKKRVGAHNSGKGAKYTRGRGPVELVYHEKFETASEGKKREAELKKLTKEQKEKLVKEFKKNYKEIK